MNMRALFSSLALVGVTLLSTSVQAWWGPWNNNNYGGSDWGPMDGFMDGDFDFNMSFNTRARGYGRGNGYGSGYGYQNNGYGYPYFVPVAYAPVPATPAVKKPALLDGDNDNVADSEDLCPNSAKGSKVDFTGCVENEAITLRGVNFKLDSAELVPESSGILDMVANTLSSHPEVTVEVGGHTDSQGDDAYNLDLSARRAGTVRNYLIANGVPAANLTSSGYGETRLIEKAGTAAAHATNRRVELTRTDKTAIQVTQQ